MKKLVLFWGLFPLLLLGQTKKEVTTQTQSWTGLMTTFKVNDRWGFIADTQIRRNNFVADDNFYLLRGGASYMATPNLMLVAGYAHQWTGPTKPEWSTFSNENRVYQQVVLNTKFGDVTMTQRIRNEQRWQEKIANDKRDGVRFTDRVRYQLGFTIPIFANKKLPSLIISDELLIHFGSDVVYNNFDQNRIFIGIKQNINSKLSFDFGYLNVYQQKFSGYQYENDHVLRLFFYYNGSLKSKTPPLQHEPSGD